MKVAIMQPYFLPYIGYFQLINAVDVFVIYDNIQFSKKGWFHRNRMLQNGADTFFTIPLKSDSDYLDVNRRFIAESWKQGEKEKLSRKFKENYKKAPFFEQNWPLFEGILNQEETNLFEFNYLSLKKICEALGIQTLLEISSNLEIDHSLKGQEKVIAICQKLHGQHYINPIGGIELYEPSAFKAKAIELSFLKSKLTPYQQFGANFVPALSILDLFMFKSIADIKLDLLDFDLLKK